MTDDPYLPTVAEIIATHEEVEDVYNLKHTGTRVAAPKLKTKRIIRDADEYNDVYTRAAYLLRKLITRHVFEDGNKRTAWVTTRKFLDDHGEIPAEHGPNAEQFLKRIRRYDVEEIAEWLETGNVDEDRLKP
ncbi:Fic family protein [Halobacterium sp. KA-6]|uniref:Fic family protein n=1 Tax=Halobacterium sp. KA-6 TaxID=2896368 RepID=UPI001E5A7E31|nr:Fic family protein [Halobacterium sp. KA-6]MCD2203852.1 Fic family protein [Halobacterium sp. KA-6]